MDDFLNFLIFEEIVLKRGGDVHQRHACFDTILEIDVFIEVLRRPKIYQLDGVVDAADTVNAAKALDDANGIPVDIVVDEVIAVLKILALGNAVRGDEQINLGVLWHGRNFVAVFGARGKVGEDLVVVRLAECGVVAPAARDQRDMNAKFLVRPGIQRLEQVFCGIGKGGEYKHLFVQFATFVRAGVFDFTFDELLQLFELRVALRCNGFGRGMKQTQLLLVPLKVFQPVSEIQMLQTVFEFAANLHWVIAFAFRFGNSDVQFQFFGLRILIGRGLIIPNFPLQVFNLANGPPHCDFK